MIPPSIENTHDYTKYTSVPVQLQFRDVPDFMDLCSAEVKTDWFMITNSYHQVAKHVDLMFTPGKFNPVIPFTPATFPFCLKYPYCKEIIMLSQRWNIKHKQVVLDMDMLYNTKERNAFCSEWHERNGLHGEDLYAKHQPLRWKLRQETGIIGPKGPTGSDYLAYLAREKKDGMYKMTDRSLYGARAPFVKVYSKEEKLDGMSEDELARRLGMTLLSNVTECSCDVYETEEECIGSGLGCQWRPLFESCHPPEMIDDGVPICETTESPTLSPTISIERLLQETDAPTNEGGEEVPTEGGDGSDTKEGGTQWLTNLFKTREHEVDNTEAEEGVNDLDGRRNLLVAVSDKEDSDALLKTFDPISVTDNMSPGAELIESLSRGEVESVVSTDTMSVPTETLCPTWGPSNVPRRINLLNDENLDERTERVLTPLNSTRINASHSSPGKARHSQLQLVQLDPATSLDSSSIIVPSPDEVKKMRQLVSYGEQLTDLRIVFDTTSLSTHLKSLSQNFAMSGQYNPTKARVTALTEKIFPSIVDTWSRVLRVYATTQNIYPPASCGEIEIPKHHNEIGFDADVVLYVQSKDESSCSDDPRPQISICQFDQQMKPLIGSLSICLNDMDVQNNSVYDKEVLHYTALLSQLVGRFLGLSPSLFKYFRDPETSQLWGERPMAIDCGDDEQVVTHETMLPNVIQQVNVRDGMPFYEIATPTVKQVARNAFDCQTMSGARLEAPLPDNNGGCAFFNLDLRYHFDEDMTSISQNEDGAFGVSPLSLALLEDSSWYKANFAAATTPTFGRGAGCGFVESSCITGGKIPDYSKGFFCANVERQGVRSGCNHNHHNKAGCDVETDISPPEDYQYFLPDHPDYGSPFEIMHHCPMQTKHLVSCSTKGHVMPLNGESYDESSRCFETDANTPVCLETICNPRDKTLSVVVNGKSFYCAYHGEVINVDVGYSIKCPRLAAVCPDLVCPSNCSGKGVCDYCKEVPVCICDDPLDDSAGCWNS